MTKTQSRLTAWSWFVVWMIVGAGAAISAVSFALWPLIVPVAAIGVALCVLPHARPSAWGLLTGCGIAFLVVAYIQRDGPGTTCWRTATAAGCDQHLDPRPWLVAGVILLFSGIAAHCVARSTRSLRPRTPSA